MTIRRKSSRLRYGARPRRQLRRVDEVGAATMPPNVTARHRAASSSAPISNRGFAERYEQGVALRRKTPREKHADLLGPANRNPVVILAAGDRTRVPELVPVRSE